MNPFEKKAISSETSTTTKVHPLQALDHKTIQAEKWVKSHLLLSFIAVILGLLTLKGVVGATLAGNPFSIKQIFISALGGGLKTDGTGNTNILLLGVGGEGHDGANLTDTMIIASLNNDTDTVSMLSIPRDLYVESKALGWGSRINSIYEYVYDENKNPEQAEAALQVEIEKILGITIQYYAKIDFAGFTQIVDSIDGITINVQKSIQDDTYPAPDGSGYFYDPLYIPAGLQEMDGETALKYARSRHVEGGDFDRAKRQQEVISAIKEKALSLGVLTSPSKIKGIYNAITRNFQTNLTVAEMINLLDRGKDLGPEALHSAVFSDEAYTTGGFLYTPPRGEGDPFYLAPYAGDFSELKMFTDLFFHHPEVIANQVPIRILNGTHEESLAGITKMMLVRYGFNVASYGNAGSKDKTETKIYVLKPDDQAVENTANIVQNFINGEVTETVPLDYQDTDASIVIELGDDFANYYQTHEDLFYIGFY